MKNIIVSFLATILLATGLYAEIPSSADWSNALWQLIEDRYEIQEDGLQLELPQDSKDSSKKKQSFLLLKS